METIPYQDDSIRQLMCRTLAALGGSPSPYDCKNDVLRKLVIVSGGAPAPLDDEFHLLSKFAIARGVTALPLDGYHNVLRRLVDAETGYFRFSESVWRLWFRLSMSIASSGAATTESGDFGLVSDASSSSSDWGSVAEPHTYAEDFNA